MASLEKLLKEKQAKIEELMSAEIMIGGLPTKVYKKLEHVNVQYEEKLQ